jgi:hypothetical protein
MNYKNIKQLNGSESVSDDMNEDGKYVRTVHYLEQGTVVTVFHTFLDVLDGIEKSYLSEESKDLKKTKVLAARKETFGNDFEICLSQSSK